MNEPVDKSDNKLVEKIIMNIQNSNTFISFFNKTYNKFYGDKTNKLCFVFTPRAGNTNVIQCFLEFVNLLEDSKCFPPWVHEYTSNYFDKYTEHIDIDELIKEKYTFIKFIMNPYIRAVSSFRLNSSYNLSFRDYLKILIKGLNNFSDHDIYHIQQQYQKDEEKIITKYIRINENETYTIQLKDGSNYLIDTNKYKSGHEGKKTNNTEFCGDIPRDIINTKLPSSYKYFYDEEIKKMVEIFYKDDIEKYNFSFDQFE